MGGKLRHSINFYRFSQSLAPHSTSVAGPPGRLVLLIPEAQTIRGVDAEDGKRHQQLKERPGKIKEFKIHGKMKGRGEPGSKGQIKENGLFKTRQHLGTSHNPLEDQTDGLQVRTGALLLVLMHQRQKRIVEAKAVKAGQEVLSGYVQDGFGVGTVKHPTGEWPIRISRATFCSFVVKGAAPSACSAFEFEEFVVDRFRTGRQRLEGKFASAYRDQIINTQLS